MDEFDRLNTINNDGLLSWSRGMLWLCGFVYLLIGCGGGYNFGASGLQGMPAWAGWGLGFIVFAMCAFFALVNFVVANGLANGSKWAWFVGIGLAVLYLPSCCFPFGALILAGLGRKSVREAYGIG